LEWRVRPPTLLLLALLIVLLVGDASDALDCCRWMNFSCLSTHAFNAPSETVLSNRRLLRRLLAREAEVEREYGAMEVRGAGVGREESNGNGSDSTMVLSVTLDIEA